MLGDRVKRVGNYDIHRYLARGKFGEVNMALKDGSTTPIVVKSMPSISRSVSRDKWNEIIHTEIDVLKELAVVDCDYVVKFIGDFHTPNNHYIAMEYCDGGDLHSYITQRQSLGEDIARRIMYHISLGLNAMHTHPRRIIHRDIKPANILMTSKNVMESTFKAKIGDFGMAKILYDKDLMTMAMSETRVGTPYYMSLERLYGKDSDFDSDIWALGIMMYQLVCGTVPFPARSENELMRMIRSFNGNVIFPQSITISDECKNLITSMLNPSKRDRITISSILLHKWFEIERRRENFKRDSNPIKRFSMDASFTSLFSSGTPKPSFIKSQFSPDDIKECVTDIRYLEEDENRDWKSFYLFLKGKRYHGRSGLLMLNWDDVDSCDDHAYDCVEALNRVLTALDGDVWCPHIDMCKYGLNVKIYNILKGHVKTIANPFKEDFSLNEDILAGWIYGHILDRYSEAISYMTMKQKHPTLDILIEVMILLETLIRDRCSKYSESDLEKFHNEVCEKISSIIDVNNDDEISSADED
jgi:serine/threonine protein kinase